MKVLPVAILSWLLFGPLGILGAVWAVLSIGRGEYLTAVVAAGVSAFCLGLILPLAKAVRGTVTPRGTFDDNGTVIRPDRFTDLGVRCSLFGLVVASGLFAVFEPLDMVDIPVPHEMRFYLPFASAATAAVGAPLAWRILRRGTTKYLRLTPDGFEFAEGLRTRIGDWAQVRDVTDVAPGQSAPVRGAIVVLMSDESAAAIAGASFTPEGRALREMVRFYWQHPNRRDELTDGRGVKRLADQRFDAEPN